MRGQWTSSLREAARRLARHPMLPLVEVVAMTAMLLSYIWVWQERFAGADTACLTLYFGIGGP